jgi:NADH-quinone oxidoreductase subunit B
MGVIAKTSETGTPTAPDADFFKDIDSEVSDKGFVVTSTEDLFNWISNASVSLRAPVHASRT